uniref:DUF222 domain-containing protein n=1 Tax=Parastrongyloides trichosuri TaxID=131310 RepID=A0A0N4ZJM9_PARTI
MSARLDSLGDHHVEPGGDSGAAFLGGGGAGDQDAARRLQRRDLVGARQAEMDADHGWPFLDQHGQLGVVGQEALIDVVEALGRGRAELTEDRAQAVDPDGVPRRIGRDRRMAEQIDVERPVGQRLRRPDGLPARLGVYGPQGDGAQRPCVRHGGGQFGGRGSRHRRLDQGDGQAEAIGQGGLHRGSFARFCTDRR